MSQPPAPSPSPGGEAGAPRREVVHGTRECMLERVVTERTVELELVLLPRWGDPERDYTMLFNNNVVVRRVVRDSWFGTYVLYALRMELDESDARRLRELMLGAKEIIDYHKVVAFLHKVKALYRERGKEVEEMKLAFLPRP